MRNESLRTLTELAAADERIVFLTGDLGFSVVEPFFDRFPQRSFNVGVAEQNMAAMAAGLAEAGLIPFVYSIATFATLRPFEFIRNGAILQQLPVRILGVGAGMEYAINGPSHYALEDVGVLRTQPGLRIVVPGDALQARAALESTYDSAGPIYYRLSKGGPHLLPGLDGRWTGRGLEVLEDGDGSLALIALGNAGAVAVDAGAALVDSGIRATTAVVSQISPAPTDALRELMSRHSAVVTIESHYATGGLGSLVCEVIADHRLSLPLRRCAVRQTPVDQVGSAEHMAAITNTDASSVVAAALDVAGCV